MHRTPPNAYNKTIHKNPAHTADGMLFYFAMSVGSFIFRVRIITFLAPQIKEKN
jgi:hypothetical protein